MVQGPNFVRTAGEAGQAARRAPGALAAGIVRSGPGAGRDVREWETDILCTSEPDGLAAGAGALPGARRRCEAGKRTHGPGTRACLALLAATALLALAAPAQAQTEIWSATLTPQDLGSGALGCNSTAINTAVECSNTDVLSGNDFMLGFTDHSIGIIELGKDETLQITSTGVFTDADTLVLVLGTTSLAFSDGIIGSGSAVQIWVSTGISWTAGTDVSVRLISLTAPGAPTGLAATANGPSRIDLAWTAPASTGGSAITGYKIEVSANGTSGWTDQVANTNSTATTSAHTGLGAGDTRHYRVSAINANGTGVPSNVDSATTASTNTAAMGAPTITGTAQVGQTLTAATTGITDADGLTSPTYTYQWIRVDGTDEADIAAANSSTYILGAADLGTTLTVRVTFADDLGHTETLTSAATATVGAGAVATAPTVTAVAVTSTPASGTTYYLAGEVIAFTVTFSAPVTVTGTPTFAFRLGAATRQAAYASGSDSAALVFARTVQAGEVDSNGISWNAIALALDGGTITQTGATTAARLTHAAQASLEGHRVDAAPPMQVSASVQGLALVLVYDEPLDPASLPATGAYTVTATGGATTTTPAVSAVSIYGIWVTLTLDAAPAAGATVTLAYAPPASNPVQDEAGNDAPAFSGQTVNGAAANTLATGAPTITGTAQVGQTLTAGTTAIMDADGLTSVSYTYQWIRVATDNTETNIASAAASTYMLVAADQGTTVKVTVRFTDDANNPETRTSAATATVSAAANTLATGAPTITGTAQVGQTLTAGTTAIMDADGLTSVSYTYQWIRVATDNTETNIASAAATSPRRRRAPTRWWRPTRARRSR